MKRLFSVLLILAMILSLSAAALAAEECPDEAPAEAAEEVIPEAEEPAEEETPAEEVPAEEAAAEEAPAAEEIPEEEIADELPAADAEEAPVEDGADEIVTGSEDGPTGSNTTALPYDSDTLLAVYLNSALGDDLFDVSEGPVLDGGSAAGDRLTGENKNLYNQVTAAVKKLADGSATSSVIELTVSSIDPSVSYSAADLGISGTAVINSSGSLKINPDAKTALYAKLDFDLDKVMDAVMADMPYNMYWYGNSSTWTTPSCSYYLTSSTDLTTSSIRFKSNIVTLTLSVNSSYSAGTNTVKTGSAPKAFQTAASVVSAAASKSDYEKLEYYRDWICDAVSYNTAANEAGIGNYGNLNPWNIVYVFDGDSSTNVVCEGYSRAFLYLCDMTDWDGSVTCINASGTMGGAAHTWNIVSIGGKNYMVDVTNCDTGMFGAPDKLFMVGGSGSVSKGYTFLDTKYLYDTTEMLALYPSSALTLAGSNYEPSVHTHSYTTVVTKEATCTTAGSQTLTCAECGSTKTETIPALGHSYTAKVTKAATCTAAGTKTLTCSRCGDTKTETIAATGHSYTAKITKAATLTATGIRTYTCSVCGNTYTEVIPKLTVKYNGTGWTKDSAGNWYYFKNSIMQKGSWISSNGSWYYLDASTGVMAKSGTATVSGKTYLFDANGKMLTGWQKINNAWYYFGSAMYKDQWLKYNGSWYYFNDKGVMVKGGMVAAADGKTYLFDSTGKMLTGWQKINNVWYYFGSAMYANQWLKSGSSWYYFNGSGKMVTGSGIRCRNSSGVWSTNNFSSTGKWLGAA